VVGVVGDSDGTVATIADAAGDGDGGLNRDDGEDTCWAASLHGETVLLLRSSSSSSSHSSATAKLDRIASISACSVTVTSTLAFACDCTATSAAVEADVDAASDGEGARGREGVADGMVSRELRCVADIPPRTELLDLALEFELELKLELEPKLEPLRFENGCDGRMFGELNRLLPCAAPPPHNVPHDPPHDPNPALVLLLPLLPSARDLPLLVLVLLLGLGLL
jgi:hypothetical protein